MEKDQASSQYREQLQGDIQTAVEAGQNVKESVRRITFKALTEGNLDSQSVKKIAEAVVKGAEFGVTNQSMAAKEVLNKAVSGLDEALSKAAEASTLAMKEAAGRGEEFSTHELKRTLNDMQGLEALFIEVLQDGAKASKAQTSTILEELAGHAQNSGTAVGQQLKECLKGLVGEISSTGKSQIKSGVKAAQTTTLLLSKLAAGMLEGLADSIETSNKSVGDTKVQSQDKAD